METNESASGGMSPAMMAGLREARAASRALRASSREARDGVLLGAARLLEQRAGAVLDANAEDLRAFDDRGGAGAAFRDRLLLDGPRIAQMAEGLRQVAALDDPVGEEVERRTLANGLVVRRVRSPLGVILLIFESRPNVAVEAFSLALKAGNAIILRGGRESMGTTAALYRLLHEALGAGGLPAGALLGVTDSDRAITAALLQQPRFIDVVVPRGGEALIDFVVRSSRIPVIKNDRGLCHVYVHEDADLAMAIEIIVNAKTQRPGVCNAMETLLAHERIAPELLPALHDRISRDGPHPVVWFADAGTRDILAGRVRVEPAGPGSFDVEHLDYKMSAAVVGSFEQAVEHIEEHGSRHSECIVTRSPALGRRFQEEVDAAAVYVNASTRFTDGFSLGLGGELGISTQKLHVRGPVGLRELTSLRWWMDGNGQIRT